MTTEYRDRPIPTMKKCGHWYAGPERRDGIITGDWLRVVKFGGDTATCETRDGMAAVIPCQYIEQRPSPLD
jgi:hypothetical protein